MRLQRRAISTEFASASGMSANSAAISWRGAQVLLTRVAAHPAGVGEQRAVVDAHARLVGIKLLGLQEAHVVGRHDGHAALGRQRHGAGDVRLFEGAAQALQLEVEAPGKQRQPRLERAFGVVLAPVDQRAADVPLGGAGERDQAGDDSPRSARRARCAACRAPARPDRHG